MTTLLQLGVEELNEKYRVLHSPLTEWYTVYYNPPISFRASSLSEAHHVAQNRTVGIRRYPSSNIISVVRFY